MTTVTERPPYPIGIPFKFTTEGIVQRYPGNTTLCHIPVGSPIISGLRAVYDLFGSHATLSPLIRLLPPDSWHMTILDGVREIECEPGMWPENMEKLPLEECTTAFAKSLRTLGQELDTLSLAPPYRMRVRGFQHGSAGFGLDLEGATQAEEKRMRRLRDKLASTLGFRAPNHEIYQFHISIAYFLRHIDGDNRVEFEKALAMLRPKVEMEVELGQVEFCTFENMFAFPRVFYLGERQN